MLTPLDALSLMPWDRKYDLLISILVFDYGMTFCIFIYRTETELQNVTDLAD